MAPHEEEMQTPPLEVEGSLMEKTDCNHQDLMEKKERAVADQRQVPAEGGVGDPATDEIMLDLDGDHDLLFSDDTFPSLPDFPCVSSPKGSGRGSQHQLCLSSSSSSSSSSWPFLTASDASMQQPAGEAMVAPVQAPSDQQQQQPEDGGLQIPDDIDLLDLTSDPWDPSSLLFPDEALMALDAEASTPAADEHQIMPEADQLSESFIGAAAGGEGPSAELANIFLEWLKCNKDSISPEDLRSIKLKRATIECAARRLGGGMHGRTQLVKLILAWVQNHHLQKRRRRHRQQQQLHHDRSGGSGGFTSLAYSQYQQHQQQQFAALNQQVPILSDPPMNPNPNLDFNTFECNSWAPYPDPGTPSAFPAVMGYGGSEQQMYPRTPASPYHYPTSSIVVSSQPFSRSPDFHAADPTAVTWPPPPVAAAVHFPGPPSPYSQFLGPPSPLPITSPQYSGGAFASQFSGQGLSSATKEARKKRMARQKRFSSLHQHRHHQNQGSSRSPAAAAPSSSSSIPNPSTSWAFWPPFPASSQHINTIPGNRPPPAIKPPPAAPRPPGTKQHTQHQSTTAADKRQGWKTEKNLRFLLQKVLKQSDVGSLGRIVLPKKEAEIHLPELDSRDGISIPMEDIGTSRIWNMKYRFWPNNKSRMYLLENTGEFVRANGLQEGDFIVIYSDIKCGKYMIRGVKVRQPAEGRVLGGGGRNAAKIPKKAGTEKAAPGASKSKSYTAMVRGEDCHGCSSPSSAGWEASTLILGSGE